MFRTTKWFTKLGLLVCLAGALVACGGGEERQAEYLERAQRSYDEGNYEKARVDAKNVLQINANNADARYLMALLEEQEGNWRGVFGNLNAVVELDENHLEAITKLGNILLASKQLEDAAARAEKAMELAPDNADSLALMAAVEAARENKDKAEDLARRALAVDGGQEQATAILVSLYAASDPEQALQLIESALAVNPGSAKMRLLHIRMLNSMERTDEAIASAELLIAQHPDENNYILSLAQYYNTMFRPEDAEALLRESIVSRPQDVELKLTLVRQLAASQDRDAAIAELEAMLAAEPETFQLRASLGQLLFSTGAAERAAAVYEATFEYDNDGADSQAARVALARLARSKQDWDTARRWIDEALELEPENPGALISKAAVSIAQGNYEQAVPDLRRALRSQPDSVEGLLLLAETERVENKNSLALENYRKVLGIDANNLVALYQSGLLLAAQQDYAAAAANLEKVAQLQPGNVQAIITLVEVYSAQERWDDAAALVDSLSAAEETKAIADLISSGLALRQGKFDDAITLAKSALESNEELTVAAVNIARAHVGKGDVPGAIAYLEPYFAKHADNKSIADIMAQLYLSNEQPDKATTVYVELIEQVPTSVGAYTNLGRLYALQNMWEKLQPLYRKGIDANPDNIALRAALAEDYQRDGQLEEALGLLEEAYQLDKTSQVVINNLSMILLDHYPTAENLQRVQGMTRDFERTGVPVLLDTAGWLQYRLGNPRQAISLLEAAREAGGQGAEYHYHLGMAYYKNGQLELAKEQLAKALENDQARFSGRAEAEKVYSEL